MTNIKKKMKFFYKKINFTLITKLTKHLNIINYSLNNNLKKKYSLLIKKK